MVVPFIPPRRVRTPGRRAALGAAAVLLASGCGVPAEGPLMRPGRDCLGCHSASGGASPAWTVAGTVFTGPADPPGAGLRDVQVHLVDAAGRAIALRTNAAGNFYTREPLRFPVQARIEKDGVNRAMVGPVPHGGCNACHTVPPPSAGPAGRIALVGGEGGPLMSPGESCQACHDGSAALRWSASGTVYPLQTAAPDQGVAGVTIRIVGASGLETTLLSNAAGNFYTPETIAFPAQVQIEIGGLVRAMEDSLPHGDCNACHAPGREAGGRVALGGED